MAFENKVEDATDHFKEIIGVFVPLMVIYKTYDYPIGYYMAGTLIELLIFYIYDVIINMHE